MKKSLGNRIRHAWNAFQSRDPTPSFGEQGYGTAHRPDRLRLNIGNERSIVASIYNRIAIDVASATIRHARVDENEQYLETIKSDLNECLTISANLDQSAREFIMDVVMSLFDEGCIAIVPVDTTLRPSLSGGYDVRSMRVGQIMEWFPNHILVRVYNEKTGLKEDLKLLKKTVAIMENPFYSVMNEPNSTLKRLIRKLNLLDSIDEQSGSGKLDILIQLPYVIKTPARKLQAEERRKDIEMQLSGSKYGIAYIDGTEKVTQLNRPAENNLMKQIEYLTSMLYSQLGLTETIMDGTADEPTMLNYSNRTVETILNVICDSLKRTFLTKTARTQMQSILFFTDPFKLVPVSQLADIADKFTRNAILSSNEVRGIIGYKPSKDPAANELSNKNIASPNQEVKIPIKNNEEVEE